MAPAMAPGRVLVAGSLNLDVAVTVPHLPQAGETLQASGHREGPGGKGLNQAIAAARAGAPVVFLGCVGDDAAGRRLLDALAAEQVDVAGVRIAAGVPSGLALVSVDEAGVNSIVVVPGANAQVHAQDLGAVAASVGDVLVAQGEIPLAATEAFIGAGRAAGARTIVNLAPFHAPSVELLQAVSILVVNEVELLALAGALAGDDPGPVDGAAVVGAARRVIAHGAEAVVITLGAAGMVAVTAEGVLAEPALGVVALDTTGAGDAVVGVLAAELAAGADLARALAVANAAAALVVQRSGAADSMPTRGEIVASLS